MKKLLTTLFVCALALGLAELCFAQELTEKATPDTGVVFEATPAVQAPPCIPCLPCQMPCRPFAMRGACNPCFVSPCNPCPPQAAWGAPCASMMPRPPFNQGFCAAPYNQAPCGGASFGAPYYDPCGYGYGPRPGGLIRSVLSKVFGSLRGGCNGGYGGGYGYGCGGGCGYGYGGGFGYDFGGVAGVGGSGCPYCNAQKASPAEEPASTSSIFPLER